MHTAPTSALRQARRVAPVVTTSSTSSTGVPGRQTSGRSRSRPARLAARCTGSRPTESLPPRSAARARRRPACRPRWPAVRAIRSTWSPPRARRGRPGRGRHQPPRPDRSRVDRGRAARPGARRAGRGERTGQIPEAAVRSGSTASGRRAAIARPAATDGPRSRGRVGGPRSAAHSWAPRGERAAKAGAVRRAAPALGQPTSSTQLSRAPVVSPGHSTYRASRN